LLQRMINKFSTFTDPESSSHCSQIPPPDYVVFHINSIQISANNFSTIFFNTILPSTPVCPMWSFTQAFPSELSCLMFPTYVLLVSPIAFSSMQSLQQHYGRSRNCEAPQYTVFCITISSFFGPNNHPSTLYSCTLNVRCSFVKTDQGPHPYETTDYITHIHQTSITEIFLTVIV